MANALNGDWTAFLEVARAGSFSKAAFTLHSQQPGLSRRIRRLENELQVELFERTPRGVRLTSVGQSIFDSLIEQKTNFEQSLELVLKRSEEPQGIFRLGCHRIIGVTYLPRFISKLLSTYPRIKLELSFMDSREVGFGVREGTLDYGLVVDPAPSPHLISRKIAKEEVGAYRAKRGEGKTKQVLYNPEMFFLNRAKPLLTQGRAMPISDYEVIGALAREMPDFLAILPSQVAERWGLKFHKNVKGATGEISLIYRRALRGTPVTALISRALLESPRPKLQAL